MKSEKISKISATELPEGRELDLSSFVGVLLVGKWKILAFTLAAALVGALYALKLTTPLFTSSAVVALDNRDEQIVDFQNVISGLNSDTVTINTEVEVFKARTLIGDLVEALDLQQDPEFNVRLREPTMYSLGAVIGAVRDTLLGAPEAPPEPTERAIRDATIDRVLGSLSVVNIRQSYVFRLTFETWDANKSALMANHLAELYIDAQRDFKQHATREAAAWLEARVVELRDELERSMKSLNTYNTNTELISAEALAGLNRQLKDFRKRLIGARETAEQTAQRVAALEAARNSGDRVRMAAISEDPALEQRVKRLTTTDTQTAELFDTRFTQVLARAQFDLARAREQVGALASQVEEQEAEIAKQSDSLVRLQQLQREVEANRSIYEYFVSRLKETSVQQGIQQADSRILSYAVVPEQPSHPRTMLILTMSTLLGAFVGAALVLFAETGRTGFRTADEIEGALGTAVIGQVPRAPVSKRARIVDYIVDKPASAFVEAVRNLRTSILLSNIDNPPQIIMLVSSVPGEGKTTQSLALAQNYAGLGKKVILIEGDIRRRTLREYFHTKDARGLFSVVSDKAPLAEVAVHDDRMGVDILMGERSSINAADFFSSDAFKRFLDKLRESYDIVIIDTPPVLAVSDARVIGQQVDSVVYVVNWDKTPRTQVEQGLRALATVNVKVSGVVLNQINPRRMKRYGGQHAEAYNIYGSNYYDV